MQEPTREVKDHRIAMLIDGDNAQPSLIQGMLTETGKYGVISIRRVYGDWTEANMKPWKNTLNLYAVQPIQQFRYTTGKNATDSAMIIDAMDLLYEGVANGFCIVSSDSDYTRLATRIREKGLFVMAIGRRETPRAFVNACEVFIYTENLQAESPPAIESPPPKRRRAPRAVRSAQAAPTPAPAPADPVPLLKSAYEMAAQDDDGWAVLATLGSRLRQLDPGFDPRTYGKKQLSLLIRDLDAFEVNEVKTGLGPTFIYVRPKE